MKTKDKKEEKIIQKMENGEDKMAVDENADNEVKEKCDENSDE